MASAKETYRVELRAAARQLGERCLYSAAKWAAELLVGVEPDAAPAASAAMDSPSSSYAASGERLLHLHRSGGSSFLRRLRPGGAAGSEAGTPLAGVSYVSTPIPGDDAFDADADKYLLAKTYFDGREYRRAAHVLRNQTGRKAVFLRCYALYMAGEKRKEEEMVELEGSLGKSNAVNQELVALEKELSTHQRTGSIDSFGLYLYGIVLRDKGCDNQARTVLVESVNSYPWNWSAWSELQSLCISIDILNSLNLKNHWMKDFFLASAYLELQMHEEALKRYERLMGAFCCSDYIQAQIATVQYSMRDLDEADMIFEELLRTDPFGVDSMDIYSNLLYAKKKLICFDLKGQHEKSVLYFQRALKLNRKYLSAWTLMGHEFVELKNTPAATDAYRRAVDINPRYYRAWYGLGQIYEMMGMPFYALYYFQKSSYVQPNDARLWIAMAQCYESDPLQMIEEAIKCYERAADSNGTEGIALHQLAKLHDMLGQSEEAAFYYKKDLERMEVEERQGQNFVEALLFLAKHYKSIGRFEEAEHYCTRLLDYTGPGKETAKKILQGLKRAVRVPFSGY
ncbi:hypothetical protein ACP4OV_008399 [Aristida adscensionis]